VAAPQNLRRAAVASRTDAAGANPPAPPRQVKPTELMPASVADFRKVRYDDVGAVKNLGLGSHKLPLDHTYTPSPYTPIEARLGKSESERGRERDREREKERVRETEIKR